MLIKNKSVPTKQTQSISQNLNKNRNNNWFEENFLVNQENTPPNISNKFNNNVNNNNNQSQNNIGYLDKENENKKISNNQIIILNLPKKTKKSNLLNLFKDYNPKKIIIFNNKSQTLKYAFITFQTQLIRDNSLSLNEITFLNNKIYIKKAFEKTLYKNNYQKNQNFQKTFKEYENKITNLEREVQQLKLIIEQNENTLNLKFNKLNLKFLEECKNQKDQNENSKFLKKNLKEETNKIQSYYQLEKNDEIIEIGNDNNCDFNNQINKNKNKNKKSLKDFYIKNNEQITKQTVIIRPKSQSYINLSREELFKLTLNNTCLNNLKINADKEIFEFLINFERKNYSKPFYQLSNQNLMNCIQENSKKFLSEVNLETINIESNINNKIQTISEFENENDCSELVVHNNKEKKVQKNLDFFLNKQKSQLGINTNNKNNELILINKNINKKIININLTKNKNKNKTVKCKGFSKTTNNRCKNLQVIHQDIVIYMVTKWITDYSNK
ncbi:ras gtpase-activating protein-binding protein [Anaeramoeba flamelloides]|uniref:Ras gtpase-activating protein-binding protein n=1 Tax=Anaeramoeba flamelloides TaxID=1746091 RepID=A0ABQ8Y4M2_9EUKA|nr:ras gtpase-activating protein-binding protein [Anaeramoeba flamelloides]